MTRDQLDQLTRRYLAAKLDEIEERLALEWTDTTGREVHVDDLCELAGKLDAELSRGSYERALEDVRRHAPGLDAETERKLARRFLEAKAAAVAQEVAAFTGQRFALARALEPAVGAATPSTHRATLPFSEVARLYGEGASPRANGQQRLRCRIGRSSGFWLISSAIRPLATSRKTLFAGWAETSPRFPPT